MTERTRKRIMILLAVFFSLTEIIKQIILFTTPGGYQIWYFPFQLCSMPVYLLPATILTKEDRQRRLLLCFLGDYMLVGGVAVLFDTSGMIYDVPILTVHSFLWHGRMLLLSLLIITGSDYDTSMSMALKETGLYLFLAFIAQIFNILLRGVGQIDMFYISPFTHMRQVVFSDIALLTGDMWAKVVYMLATILAAALVKALVKKTGLRRL